MVRGTGGANWTARNDEVCTGSRLHRQLLPATLTSTPTRRAAPLMFGERDTVGVLMAPSLSRPRFGMRAEP